MKDAVRDAVKAAGVKKLEVGGKLIVEYRGEGQKAATAKKTHNPPKMFKATYVPPVAGEAKVKVDSTAGKYDEPPF